jgi:hypothetical protein
MSISRKLKNASSGAADGGGSGGGSAGGASDDVFSTYLYTGTGGTQTITNGIDLAGEGGLVWIKNRELGRSHALYDTERGPENQLYSDLANGEQNTPKLGLKSFNEDGFTLQGAGAESNGLNDYVSWTFRKAPNFFDVVTYTGTGIQNRRVPHNLGCRPGLVIVKSIDSARDWYVWHNSFPEYTGGTTEGDVSGGNVTGHLLLNTADEYKTRGHFTYVNDDAFGVNYNRQDLNVDGEQYVAYVFAHDDSDESMIKCGSYTGNGNVDGPEIDLGFEPQWLLIKNASESQNWILVDSMRGFDGTMLAPNDSSEESIQAGPIGVSATGFQLLSNNYTVNKSNNDYIYMAIRRPNKPAGEFNPEELFGILDNIPANSANSNTVIPTDNEFDVIMGNPDYVRGNSMNMSSRHQGGKAVCTNSDRAEFTSPSFYLDYMKAFRQGIGNGTEFLAYTFKRQPGFFDVVCYEGDGQAGREVPHNLGVAPEMMWVKCRSQVRNWMVYAEPATADYSGILQLPNGFSADSQSWNGTAPTSTHFTVGSSASTNFGAEPMIAYLFASVPGISKVGSYTGTGADLDIDCGFTNGARFVIIKRTDADGDWMHFDTERGISEGNSPMVKLNETDAQASGSYIKPHSKGFTVTSTLTGIDGAEYIYYAIA